MLLFLSFVTVKQLIIKKSFYIPDRVLDVRNDL